MITTFIQALRPLLFVHSHAFYPHFKQPQPLCYMRSYAYSYDTRLESLQMAR